MLAAVAQPAWCTTIFTTFGPGDSYSGGGYTIGSVPAAIPAPQQQEIAVSFVAGFSGTLDSIRMGVGHFPGGPDSYILTLASDSLGQPGLPLETLTGLVFPPIPGAILTVNSATHSTLSAGSTYWVVMAATNSTASFGLWGTNDQGIVGASRRNSANSFTWTANILSPSPAVEVNAITPVPEPATAGLMFAGLAALAISTSARRNRAWQRLRAGSLDQ